MKRCRRSWSDLNPGTTKRCRRSWSDLNPDLLHLIIQRLGFIDFLRFRSVCSSWRSTAQSHLEIISSSSDAYPPFPQTPWLLLPSSSQEETTEYDFSARSLPYDSFISLDENRAFPAAVSAAHEFLVGSSRGWLVLLNESANSCRLFNPITTAQISLPSFPESLLQRIFNWESSRISKAIISSDPSRCDDFWVIAIYGMDSRIAVLERAGDPTTTWLDLTGRNDSYADIICSGDHLLALSNRGSVDVWDLREPFPPTKQGSIGGIPPAMGCAYEDSDRYSTDTYLVQSSGDLLLVERMRGEFTSIHGEALCESDLLAEKGCSPQVCPYSTLFFVVFKLEPESGNWAKVESLGDDGALILGGNESISVSSGGVSGIRGNCIYFTDDYWLRMNEDYLYGGHDSGVFSLADGKIRPVSDDVDLRRRIQPPPFWFNPNPW